MSGQRKLMEGALPLKDIKNESPWNQSIRMWRSLRQTGYPQLLHHAWGRDQVVFTGKHVQALL